MALLPARASVRPAVRKKSCALSNKPLTVGHYLTGFFAARFLLLGDPLLVGRQSIRRRTSGTQFLGKFKAKLDLGRGARHGCSTHYIEGFGELILDLANLLLCVSHLLLNGFRNFVQLRLVIRHSVASRAARKPNTHNQLTKKMKAEQAASLARLAGSNGWFQFKSSGLASGQYPLSRSLCATVRNHPPYISMEFV